MIAISLDKHAENEAIRKTMLQELDKSKDEAKELQTKVTNDLLFAVFCVCIVFGCNK